MNTRIRYLRRRSAWTQDELAAKAGLSNQTIVNIERGKKEPMVGTIRKLAIALGVEPSELFTDDPLQSDGDEEEKRAA